MRSWSSRILDSGTADAFAGIPGVIAKAFAGVNGSPDFPQTTLFTDDVNITDPSFITLKDMSVTLNINEPSSNTELQAVLIAPDGTQITLFTNQENSAGPDDQREHRGHGDQPGHRDLGRLDRHHLRGQRGPEHPRPERHQPVHRDLQARVR